MVVCPHCQFLSQGRFYCDQCRTLLPVPPPHPLPCHLPLPDGRAVDCAGWHGHWPVDCFQPLASTCGEQPVRLYALNGGWWEDIGGAVQQRASLALEVLAPLTVVPVDDGAVVVAEALPGAPSAPRPLATHTALLPGGPDRVSAALAACMLLGRVMQSLHEAGLVWLSFDPGALEQAYEGGTARITNLDLMVYPVGTCPDTLRMLAAYSPPEVWALSSEAIGPATDVFHLGLFAYYALGDLLPDGLGGAGLEAFNFALPPLRVYWPSMPVGLSWVVERATAIDPTRRFPTVGEFLSALGSAVRQALQPPPPDVALRQEWGAGTVAGLLHQLQGLGNQDAHAVLPLPGGGLLAIVADGVTHALVGSGDQASQLAVGHLSAKLPELLAAGADPEAALERAFLEASEAVLSRALELGAGQVFSPCDLMSTTALAAVVLGSEVILASVGDSRAYLVRDGRAEQVTVDGDVRCAHLAAGAPPEEVYGLGAEAHALYTCLGVSEQEQSGQFTLCHARARPSVTRWPLRADDLLILCSDGLVEEGVFLSAAELPSLLAGRPSAPAADLARHLIAAAQSRHRVPSPQGQDACGDDVTCVVIRFSGPGQS